MWLFPNLTTHDLFFRYTTFFFFFVSARKQGRIFFTSFRVPSSRARGGTRATSRGCSMFGVPIVSRTRAENKDSRQHRICREQFPVGCSCRHIDLKTNGICSREKGSRLLAVLLFKKREKPGWPHAPHIRWQGMLSCECNRDFATTRHAIFAHLAFVQRLCMHPVSACQVRFTHNAHTPSDVVKHSAEWVRSKCACQPRRHSSILKLALVHLLRAQKRIIRQGLSQSCYYTPVLDLSTVVHFCAIAILRC